MKVIYNHNNMKVDPKAQCAIPWSLELFDLDTLNKMSEEYPVISYWGESYFITTVQNAVDNGWIGYKNRIAHCIVWDNGLLNSHVMKVIELD